MEFILTWLGVFVIYLVTTLLLEREDYMAKDEKGTILTHIDRGHDKPNVFESGVHPKSKEGCYANAEGKSEE